MNVLLFVPFAQSKQANYVLVTFLTIALTLAKKSMSSLLEQKITLA